MVEVNSITNPFKCMKNILYIDQSSCFFYSPSFLINKKENEMQQQQQSKLVQTFNAYRTRDTRSGIVRRESERQVESKHWKQKINSRKCLLLTDKIITNKKIRSEM